MVDGRGERRNFRVLLGQGIFSSLGYELTSEKLVLPFIYAALGGPVLFAGLIVPIVRVTKLGAQIVVAPIVHTAKQNKWFSAAALVTMALGLAAICLVAGNVPVVWMVATFMLVAVVLGAADGLSSLAFNDMLGRVLPERRRSVLLFAQSGIAGVLVMLVAYASQRYITSEIALDAHLELMWIGITMTLFAAVAIAIVVEPAKEINLGNSDETKAVKGTLDKLQESFKVALALPWFRRFLVARTLFLSIELAMPFYAIHAATMHADNSGGLSTFVIASSVGMVLGGIIWPRVGRTSIRLVLASAAGIGALAGLLALALERWPELQSAHPYAVVVVLIAFSAQGVLNGRTVYLIGATNDHERPYCIAVANVLTGVLAIIMAAALGTAAHFQDVRWPIWIMVALNVVAVLYVSKLADTRRTAEHEENGVVHGRGGARGSRAMIPIRTCRSRSLARFRGDDARGPW